ncbi:hypothetical protein CEXT_74201 [Caerostris extrusa]|uniref:Uncharacterized protein n=1 Tax=Caerostris extrusa TaxID=172846 RepID=A0AAV4UWW0_CAEEX|nr:hypothetical protein CEXT_74201 [Caerostris extrusa]
MVSFLLRKQCVVLINSAILKKSCYCSREIAILFHLNDSVPHPFINSRFRAEAANSIREGFTRSRKKKSKENFAWITPFSAIGGKEGVEK